MVHPVTEILYLALNLATFRIYKMQELLGPAPIEGTVGGGGDRECPQQAARVAKELVPSPLEEQLGMLVEWPMLGPGASPVYLAQGTVS